jgi:purine nucleoside phosphorylase
MLQDILGAGSTDAIYTASIGGSGTWAMDMDPGRSGFPEELTCTGPETVVAKFEGVETPFGAVPRVKVLNVGDQPVVRVPVHGWHLPNPTLGDTLATFWLLYGLGVKQIVVDASVGGIQAKPWDIVVPDDLVSNDHIKLAVFKLAQELGRAPWVRMAKPFCGRIRQSLINSVIRLKTEGLEEDHHPVGSLVNSGTYCTTPPSILETASEINQMKIDGHTVVGQSSGQEAAAARICGMCMAVINPVANYAEGLADGVWIEEGMETFYDEIALPMAAVTWWTLLDIVNDRRDCDCVALGRGEPLDKFTNH